MLGGINFQLDLNRYRLGKILGTGAFGVVISAEDRLLNCPVAIKQIPRMFDLSENSKVIMRELILLDNLRHPNIVSLIDVELFQENIYIITEQCQSNLQTVVQSEKYFKIKVHDQLSIMYQILKAIHFMHSAHVMHRDIKPSNILLDEKLRVKICDFGLARYYNKNDPNIDDSVNLTEYVVTRWYRAPEIILNACYGMEQDVWSIGCTFAFMCRRTALFPGISHPNQLVVIINILGLPNEEDLDFEISPLSRRFIDNIELDNESYGLSKALETTHHIHPLLFQLIQHMLEFNPNRRISSRLALLHPVFTSIRSCPASSPTKSAPLPSTHLQPITSTTLKEEKSTTTLTDNAIYTLSKISKCNNESSELKQLILSEISNLREHLSNKSKDCSRHNSFDYQEIDLPHHSTSNNNNKKEQPVPIHRNETSMGGAKKSFIKVKEEISSCSGIGNLGNTEQDDVTSGPDRKRSFARIMPIPSFATTASRDSYEFSVDILPNTTPTNTHVHTLPYDENRILPQLSLNRCNSNTNNSISNNKSFLQKSFSTHTSSIKNIRNFRDTISSASSIDAITVDYESEDDDVDVDEIDYNDDIDYLSASSDFLSNREQRYDNSTTAFDQQLPVTTTNSNSNSSDIQTTLYSTNYRKENHHHQQSLRNYHKQSNRPKSKSFSHSHSLPSTLTSSFKEEEEEEEKDSDSDQNQSSYKDRGRDCERDKRSNKNNNNSNTTAAQKSRRCLPRLSAPNLQPISSLSTSTATSHLPLAAIHHPMQYQPTLQQLQLQLQSNQLPAPNSTFSFRDTITTTNTTTGLRSNTSHREQQEQEQEQELEQQEQLSTYDFYNTKVKPSTAHQDFRHLTVDISEFAEDSIPINCHSNSNKNLSTVNNKHSPNRDLMLSSQYSNDNNSDINNITENASLITDNILSTTNIKSNKLNLASLQPQNDISQNSNNYNNNSHGHGTIGNNNNNYNNNNIGSSHVIPIVAPLLLPLPSLSPEKKLSNHLHDTTSSSVSSSSSSNSTNYNSTLQYKFQPQHRRTRSSNHPFPATNTYSLIYPHTTINTPLDTPLDTCRTTDSGITSDSITQSMDDIIEAARASFASMELQKDFTSHSNPYSKSSSYASKQQSLDANRRGRRQAMNTSPMIYPDHVP